LGSKLLRDLWVSTILVLPFQNVNSIMGWRPSSLISRFNKTCSRDSNGFGGVWHFNISREELFEIR
jgi:hypothetical protein